MKVIGFESGVMASSEGLGAAKIPPVERKFREEKALQEKAAGNASYKVYHCIANLLEKCFYIHSSKVTSTTVPRRVQYSKESVSGTCRTVQYDHA